MARDDDADEILTSIDRGEDSGAPTVSGSRDEPPVVARLMIEIRSDGTRTVARGAMEDLASGEKVAIEAHGRSPMSLALGLAKSIVRGRSLARSATRALLSRPKKNT